MYVCWVLYHTMVIFTYLKNLGGNILCKNPWVLSRQHMTGSENLNETAFFFFPSSFFCLLTSPPFLIRIFPAQ